MRNITPLSKEAYQVIRNKTVNKAKDTFKEHVPMVVEDFGHSPSNFNDYFPLISADNSSIITASKENRSLLCQPLFKSTIKLRTTKRIQSSPLAKIYQILS